MPKETSKNQIELIKELLRKDYKNEKEIMREKRKLAKKYQEEIISNSQILKIYKELITNKFLKSNKNLENLLKKRAVRTISGIAPVAVLTKPYKCPGNCAFCPTEKNVPQSYLSNEPAVMRAIRCNYDPYIQVKDRLKALIANGHNPTKIELIVIGGTWSYLPENYKYWYIANCFKSANDFGKKKSTQIKISTSIKNLKKFLAKEQKKNEKTKYQLIGLTLETRPDYITSEELEQMRELGCTRVEIGVQAIDDEILKLNKRGHGVVEIVQATKLLRDYGFKITYHLMPGLPGSSLGKDLEMFQTYFNNENFQPDQIKFYPTVVTKGSLLYQWWKKGKYKPYTEEELQQLIIDCKKIVPPYVRIIRLIRDIPGESIIAGNKITNLRQIMKDKGVICQCIRCREIKDGIIKKENYDFKIIQYKASAGQEYFLSFEDKISKKLLAFCRLRLPDKNFSSLNFKFLNTSAIIRELHVYGALVSRGEDKKIQHSGLGKKLLEECEKIAIKNNFSKIAIISGVGVRNYYRKNAYKLHKTYMIKKLCEKK